MQSRDFRLHYGNLNLQTDGGVLLETEEMNVVDIDESRELPDLPDEFTYGEARGDTINEYYK